nr:unnamed protein product [Digitaria exilis]
MARKRSAPPAPSLAAVPAASVAAAAAAAMAAMARKRPHRTRFSPEQKQRMQALSERLGWRLPSLDEAVVEETCREIGVTKAVFKVWMYNNRHKFIGGHISRRSRRGASAATGAVAAAILPSPPAAVVRHPSHAATIGYFRVKPATASGGSPQSSLVKT